MMVAGLVGCVDISSDQARTRELSLGLKARVVCDALRGAEVPLFHIAAEASLHITRSVVLPHYFRAVLFRIM